MKTLFIFHTGEHLRVKYDEATQVKLNKRGRLQVKDPRYKVPTALDLVYLEESPDWCRISKPLQWQGLFPHIYEAYKNIQILFN